MSPEKGVCAPLLAEPEEPGQRYLPHPYALGMDIADLRGASSARRTCQKEREPVEKECVCICGVFVLCL